MTIYQEIEKLILVREDLPAIPEEVKHGRNYVATLIVPDKPGIVRQFQYNPYTYDNSWLVDALLTSMFTEAGTLEHMTSVEVTHSTLTYLMEMPEDEYSYRHEKIEGVELNSDRTLITVKGSAMRYRMKGKGNSYPKNLTDAYQLVIVATGPWHQPEVDARNTALKQQWLVEVSQLTSDRIQRLTHAQKLIDKALSDK